MKFDSPVRDLPSNPNSQQEYDDINYPKEIIWRRNAPYFYQVLYTNELEWPSLTVEWRPDPELNQNRRNRNEPDYVTNMVYGTNTANG